MSKSIRLLDNIGRVVIPKEIRKKLNLNEGDELQITSSQNKIIIQNKNKNEAERGSKMIGLNDKVIVKRHPRVPEDLYGAICTVCGIMVNGQVYVETFTGIKHWLGKESLIKVYEENETESKPEVSI